MINISNNGIITIVKGDTIEVPVFINIGTEIEPVRYSLKPGDKLFFSIMEPHQPFECAILRHTYTYLDVNESRDVVVKLSYDDTAHLLPGEYYYEIKLLTVVNFEEHLDTIVPRTKFFIIQ